LLTLADILRPVQGTGATSFISKPQSFGTSLPPMETPL
jgi:hypothetical protein